MTYKEIDFIFPFFVFFYGVMMTLVLNSPFLLQMAEKYGPHPAFERFKSHRLLGVICLIVGSLWSLQNLWFGS
jgi:hypothetical protein